MHSQQVGAGHYGKAKAMPKPSRPTQRGGGQVKDVDLEEAKKILSQFYARQVGAGVTF
jgi:hypothetical protein